MKHQDKKLCRREILIKTNNVIDKFQLSIDELRLDLADCIDIIRNLTENYKIEESNSYNKRIIEANEYLDNFANRYIGR